MKLFHIIPMLLALSMAIKAPAQQHPCALDEIYHMMAGADSITLQAMQEKANARILAVANLKTTADKITNAGDTIPVIFHIVLNESQLKIEGGEAGIIARAKTQIDALNRDYNAANPDSVKIPAPFKALYGNVKLFFGLAHTDPNGQFTPGYTIDTALVSGFDIMNGGHGSGAACSDAKYKVSDGADAWNTERYLNVWVVNIESSVPGGQVDGIGTHPDMPFPKEEWGCVIHYGVFGQKTATGQYFLNGADSGRTLVHEVGHFFSLYHTWGTDNGDCTSDDGINDTPLQGGPVSGCPAFPRLDMCSPVSPGVMYMNYMDYAWQSCQNMFTKEQATTMNLVAHDFYPEITKHPYLLDTPKTAGVLSMSPVHDFIVSPNPSKGWIHLSFANTPSGKASVTITNLVGRVVKYINGIMNNNYDIDLTHEAKGMYIIQYHSENSIITRKILIE